MEQLYGKRFFVWIIRSTCLLLVGWLLVGCTADKSAGERAAEVSRQPRRIESKYGVYYQVFVRSFADSDGDGIGDINGLTSKLDYLNDGDPLTDTDLGVTGLWLMPINVSPSYHKYDVVDYYNIDPEYGTMEDFRVFLQEAEQRGIKVLLDLVINHTSSRHPWFKESARSENNPYRDYYVWAKEGQEGFNLRGRSSWGSRLWHRKGSSYYYGIFWDQMPDLNFDNVKVREEIKAIATFWLNKGVHGFRLDAVLHAYGIFEEPLGTNLREKNLQWWREFGAALEAVNPDVYLVGEVWASARVVAPFYSGLDSLFNFDLAEGIIRAVNSGSTVYANGKDFAVWLEGMYKEFAAVEPHFLDAPFLSNHDQERVMNRLRGDIDRAKLAAGIYLTMPGNPFIYYGEEIGMKGTKPDEEIREPFVWFREAKLPETSWQNIAHNKDTVPWEEQQQDRNSILHHYKRLIRLRQTNEALAKGDFVALESSNDKVIVYGRNLRSGGSARSSVIVLHNLSLEPQEIIVQGEDLSGAKIIFESTGTNKNRVNGVRISIAPLTTVVLQRSAIHAP